jgi:hypothetical protein
MVQSPCGSYDTINDERGSQVATSKAIQTKDCCIILLAGCFKYVKQDASFLIGTDVKNWGPSTNKSHPASWTEKLGCLPVELDAPGGHNDYGSTTHFNTNTSEMVPYIVNPVLAAAGFFLIWKGGILLVSYFLFTLYVDDFPHFWGGSANTISS